MSTYAIGDIQGCFASLMQLLAAIDFKPEQDVLWFTGDLVNRGPDSLGVLRYIYQLGDKHKVVLGNHDLHLLAVQAGQRSLHKADTLLPILQAPDCDALLLWLRRQPLMHYDAALNFAMVHAGLAANWTIAQALSLSREVEHALQQQPLELFAQMYGNQPDHWDDTLTGFERLRVIINYFTRLRYCYADGRMDFDFKGQLQDKPSHLIPWYQVKPRLNQEARLIFGHWAALQGKTDEPQIFALDTGCVWGNCLTALRLEDKQRFQVAC